jgi:predicted dehydrogenase
MEKVTLALAGAGMRGCTLHGRYTLKYPEDAQFVAVAEPLESRRNYFAEQHGIPPERRFASAEEMLAKPGIADAVIVSTLDRQHFAPAKLALENGYHLLLEKPVSTDPGEVLQLQRLAQKHSDRVFMVSYVLRYTSFFTHIKDIIDRGEIGRIISVCHNEDVTYWHMAHSFVRGSWRNSKETTFMLLAKCCHDLDLLVWLVGARCGRVASFGALTHFRPENAPEGAPARCLDGCPASGTCPYYAPAIYLGTHGFPAVEVGADQSPEARLEALRTGPYGRCVYRCDNDVVDHQVLSLEFENGATAAMTMCGHAFDNTRRIKIMGTRGELRGELESGRVEVFHHATGCREVYETATREMEGHQGGDFLLMRDFTRLVRLGGGKGLTDAAATAHATMVAFAAEAARKEGRVVAMQEFEAGIAKEYGIG